jgi:hypothetical protein
LAVSATTGTQVLAVGTEGTILYTDDGGTNGNLNSVAFVKPRSAWVGDCLNLTIVTEWHHVENGKISIVQSVFDGRPFEPMFAGVRAAK